MPSYNPADAENRKPLLPAGAYEAVVMSAAESISSKGSPMITVMLTVYGPGGVEHNVTDRLVFHPNALYRVKAFCVSAGINFDSGNLEAGECEGRNVRVMVGVEKQVGYPDKNTISAYLMRAGAPVSAGGPAVDDGDIPF